MCGTIPGSSLPISLPVSRFILALLVHSLGQECFDEVVLLQLVDTSNAHQMDPVSSLNTGSSLSFFLPSWGGNPLG